MKPGKGDNLNKATNRQSAVLPDNTFASRGFSSTHLVTRSRSNRLARRNAVAAARNLDVYNAMNAGSGPRSAPAAIMKAMFAGKQSSTVK